MRRLRVSHVVVQPVLVWDDGEELTPGPDLNALSLQPSQLGGFAAGLPDQVAQLMEQLATEQTPATESADPPAA